MFAAWAAIAWVVPAAIAGALGWKGIWGSGSAFVDYVLPLPIAGGAFHFPSFAIVSAIVFTQPWREGIAGYARGLLLAGAVAGIVTLLDLGKLASGAGIGGSWQPQPVGLFLLTDCVLAQLFVGAAGGQWPAGAREWAASLLVALVLPGVYAAAAMKADPRQKNPFVYVTSRHGPQRGDESLFYHAKISARSNEFRAAAAAVVRQHDPKSNLNIDDVAIHFFESHAAALAMRAEDASYTACVYQDGTPTIWSPGYRDCFSDHVSFAERYQKAYAERTGGLPDEVRRFLARRDACAGRTPRVAASGEILDNMEVRSCDPLQAGHERSELLYKYASDEKLSALLK